MSGHYDIDDEGNQIEVEDYDQDEIYIAEDELCDCGRCHFAHCYQVGCFGNLGKRRYWDWDEDESDDENTDESDDGDEREQGTPSSDLSDIPF